MEYNNFFNSHPVFTIEELRFAVNSKNIKSIYNNLKYYLNKNRIRSVRQGIYYVIPEGSQPDKFYPNNILVASCLSKNAVLAFHSALEVMGYGHSLFHMFFYYSPDRKRKFYFRENEFICVKIPEKLKEKRMEMFGVEKKYYHQLSIKFTNRERTFVDCLDRPEYGGGIEEVYRCIEKYPYLNFKEILEYLDMLNKKVLYAKVGFFLQQHKDQFYAEEELFKKLKEKKPASTVYFDSKRKKGKLIEEWNLIVPEIVIKRGWEEF